MAHAEPAVRGGAARTLGDINSKQSEPAIAALLKDVDEGVRIAALEALRSLDARGSIPAILPLLDSPKLSRRAAWVLASLGAKESIPSLLKMLDGDDTSDHAYALQALFDSRLDEARTALAAALPKYGDRRREQIARTLLKMGATDQIPRLLEDKDAGVRAVVAHWLGARGQKAAIPELRKIAGGEEGLEAAKQLYRMGDKSALPAIQRRLHHASPLTRHQAIQALQDLEAKEAVPDFVASLKDEGFWVRYSAVSALAALGAKEAVPEIRKLLVDSAVEIRSEALDALAELGDKEVIPRALDLLRAGGRPAGTAAEALAKLRADEALAVIAKLLASEDPILRGQACRALGELRAGECAVELVDRLKDAEGWVARCAVAALEKIGPKDSLSPLLALLEKGSATERKIAIEALARAGGREAVGPLIRSLEDSATTVRITAAMALCSLGVRDGIPLLLEERSNLTYLNMLRNPAAWEKIRRARENRSRYLASPGEVKDDVTTWAGDHGLALRWEPGSRGDLSLWKVALALSPAPRLQSDDGPTAGLASYMGDGRYAAIVEDDVIRVVPYDEAWAFWKKWIDEQPK